MPSAPIADFVRCLYEDCVPPDKKQSAFADLEGPAGEERVRAATEIWKYRDHTKNPDCRLEGFPMAPIAPDVRNITTFMVEPTTPTRKSEENITCPTQGSRCWPGGPA